MQTGLLARVVAWGRKHPKQRRLAVAMLAVIIFSRLLWKYIKALLRKIAPAIAIILGVLILIAGAITIGPWRKNDRMAMGDNAAVSVGNAAEQGDKVRESQPTEETQEAGEPHPTEETQEAGEPQPTEKTQETGELQPTEKTQEAGESQTAGEAQEVGTSQPAGDWALLLVNWEHPLDESYSCELVSVRKGVQVDARILEALTQMLSDAESLGYDMLVCSAYRPRERQAQLFEKALKKGLKNGLSEADAEIYALKLHARPGQSEHETGLCVDVVPQDQQVLNSSLEKREEEQWLAAHCAEYGFILRYPRGAEKITGVEFEPWHYRYVGNEPALEIMERGITLEEYLSEQ